MLLCRVALLGKVISSPLITDPAAPQPFCLSEYIFTIFPTASVIKFIFAF